MDQATNTSNANVAEVLVLVPEIYEDERGYFTELFNRDRFAHLTGFDGGFVQDNESQSVRNVVRGIHYQLEPHAQGKLVRAVEGEIYDVAVDLRRSSNTFGEWTAEVLSHENRRQMWIPPGFGHGFVALSETARVGYKTTAGFHPESARAIQWDDPDLGIDWPITKDAAVLSEKDRLAPRLIDAEVYG